MKSVLDVEVSCFQSYRHKTPKSVNLLRWLTSDKYGERIIALRSMEDKSRRDQIKASLPAVTVSGIFHPTRKEEKLLKHSGLICIDIDLKGNEGITNFPELKQELFKIRNVAYAGLSASGKGFFLIIPIRYPKRHKLHFKAIQKDLLQYGITIDMAPQNVASLRGYSYDSDALFRHDAIPYQKQFCRRSPRQPKIHRLTFARTRNATDTKAKVEALIQQIVDRKIDITAAESDWFRLACAFANEFGEEGRGYFHQISQFHKEYQYELADEKFNHVLTKKYNSIGIGSFFQIIKSEVLFNV